MAGAPVTSFIHATCAPLRALARAEAARRLAEPAEGRPETPRPRPSEAERAELRRMCEAFAAGVAARRGGLGEGGRVETLALISVPLGEPAAQSVQFTTCRYPRPPVRGRV